MVTKVTIMRGVSGSGKSTYARNNFPGAVILSSDDYWTKDGGDYKENFDVTKLGAAHAWNLRRFILYCCGDTALHDQKEIVIDNTNTSISELAPYYAVAQAFSIPVEIITLDVLPAVALARNTHGVPEKAHAAQAERLYANNDVIPRYWKHRIVKAWMP